MQASEFLLWRRVKHVETEFEIVCTFVQCSIEIVCTFVQCSIEIANEVFCSLCSLIKCGDNEMQISERLTGYVVKFIYVL
jgi:hypothetical protein